MRVIAGSYRSRNLKTMPGQTTRPTLDQVKESFFNRVGPYFSKGSILDVFGGSGAIAIEFLSRGCNEAVIIEKNRAAMNIIKENLQMVEETTYTYQGSYKSVIPTLNRTFDYIYCDPPYHFKESEQLLETVQSVMDQESLLFYECAMDEILKIPHGLRVIREDSYKKLKIIWMKLEL